MRLLSKKARDIMPYVAGEQIETTDLIKLNTNENPYPASPMVFQAIKAHVDEELKKYPKPNADEFREAVASKEGLSTCNVFCGNGSDDVLACAFQAFFEKDRLLYMPDITYSFYPVWAQLFDIPIKKITVKVDFSIDVKDYFGVGNVILPNPNAPTGIALGYDEIESIVKNNRDYVVVIDEAYIDFGAYSAAGLIKKYDNVLVVKTLSKGQSLAGMRAGYAIGDEALIDGLFRIKDSYNSYPVNALTNVAAKAAIEDEKYYRLINEHVIQTREWTKIQLEKLKFNVLPSTANFVFASHEHVKAKNIYLALKKKKILVRWFDAHQVDNYLRISIGTDDEMHRLIRSLHDIILEEK